jgi:uncharacterized iron-regulated membrane protein
MSAKSHFIIRRLHRYMGVLLGVQFLFWTVGGLYFSWSDMDEIHGDYDKAPPPKLAITLNYASPSVVLDSLHHAKAIDSIVSFQMISILGQPTYQVVYMHHPHHKQVQLADALTGKLRAPLSENEAVEVAKRAFIGQPKVSKITHLMETDGHHEYREQPLPAYAVSFADARHTTVYVSSEFGTIQRFRNEKWRIFDFLWMLHTMDYENRDNIGNKFLKAFSIFGLLTIFSGFTLFFVSSRRIKRKKRRNTEGVLSDKN